jgi:hypothetical protein
MGGLNPDSSCCLNHDSQDFRIDRIKHRLRNLGNFFNNGNQKNQMNQWFRQMKTKNADRSPVLMGEQPALISLITILFFSIKFGGGGTTKEFSYCFGYITALMFIEHYESLLFLSILSK